MGFNIEKWEKACASFQKNRDNMGYFVACRLREDGQVGRKTMIPEAYESYREKIQKLSTVVMNGGIRLVMWFINPNLFCYEQDVDRVMKELKTFIDTYLYDVMLGSLFQFSNDEFVGTVNQFDNIFRLRYQLSVLKFEKNHFVFPDGSFWAGKGWYKDGQEKRTGSPVWDLILGDFSRNAVEYQFQVADAKQRIKKMEFLLNNIEFDKTFSRFRIRDLIWNGENWVSEAGEICLSDLQEIWKAILDGMVIDIRIPGFWKEPIPELDYDQKSAS